MNWERALKRLGWFILIMGIFIGVVGYINQNAVTFIDGESVENWVDIPFLKDFYANISVEFISFAATILILDFLIALRQKEQLKEQLLMQLKSKHPEVADTAYRIILAHKWFKDGTLKKSDLTRSNMKGAELGRCNLQGAKLDFANLEEAKLYSTHLEQATFIYANLQGAKMQDAYLQHTNLAQANLQGAELIRADLLGANLIGANLNEVVGLTSNQLESVMAIEGATMPDGTRLFTIGMRGDKFIGLKPCLDGPTFETWLKNQRQLPPKERAISIENEVSEKQAKPEVSGIASFHKANITKDQIEGLRRLLKQSTEKNNIDIVNTYLKIRRDFEIWSISELTQNQYSDVVKFLVNIGNDIENRKEK